MVFFAVGLRLAFWRKVLRKLPDTGIRPSDENAQKVQLNITALGNGGGYTRVMVVFRELYRIVVYSSWTISDRSAND